MVTGSVAMLGPPPDYKRNHRHQEKTSSQRDPADRNGCARTGRRRFLMVAIGAGYRQRIERLPWTEVFVHEEIFAHRMSAAPDEQATVFALWIVDEGDLPGRGKEVLMDEHVHIGQENTEAGMRMVPAEDLLLGITLLHLAMDVGPGLRRECDLGIATRGIVPANVGGDEAPGADGVAVKGADEHAAHFYVALTQGMGADVVKNRSPDQYLVSF